MSDSVKVAIVRQKYNPAGGAERFVQNALMQLKNRSGFQVEILARSWKEIQGVKFNRINPTYVGSLWRDFGFSKAVQSYLKDNQYDIVQSHERIPGCQIYRAGDGLHVRWLNLRSRAGFPASHLNLHHSYLLKAEEKMFNSEELQYVICNSKMVMEEIAQCFPSAKDKCLLIYNGVDLNRFSYQNNNEVRNQIRKRLGLKYNQPVLIFVGSGFQRKGLKLAVDAIQAVSDEIALIVVGGDKRQERYKAYAKSLLGANRAIFVGETLPDEYLASADAFILPTLYDPFPNSAMEAFASGLPVFTSKQCGAAEIIQEGKNGYVFDYFDTLSQSECIRHWLDCRSSWESLRLDARNTVSSMTIKESTNRMIALYEKLMV